MEITWLDTDLVRELHEEALFEGETRGLNPGSDLKGILYRPQSWAYYRGVRSLYTLAAMYIVAIVKGHPFRDGNKRTAVLAAEAFLYLNGLDLDLSKEDEVYELVTAVAQKGGDGDESIDEDEVEDLARWIRRNIVGTT